MEKQKLKRKISFSGYGDSFFGFSFYENCLIDILKERYELEFTDIQNADYVFCGIWGNPYEYCNVNQVRIMIQGENYIPDFNYIDYAISSYPISIGDRNFFVPCGVEALIVHNYSHLLKLQNKQNSKIIHDKNWLENKKYFCNFLIGHDSEYHLRSQFFQELSKYKRIESAGTFMNNMPEGYVVNWRDESKLGLQEKCKFTICFESTKHEGFLTEKIVDAFISDTIPIYYGSDIVNTFFYKDSFIRVTDKESFEEIIQQIIEIDCDDVEYLKMINQPKLIDIDLPKKIIQGFREYLFYIFDQEPNQAYRRSRVYSPKELNDFCAWSSKRYSLYKKEVNKNSFNSKDQIKRIARKAIGDKAYEKIKTIIK